MTLVIERTTELPKGEGCPAGVRPALVPFQVLEGSRTDSTWLENLAPILGYPAGPEGVLEIRANQATVAWIRGHRRRGFMCLPVASGGVSLASVLVHGFLTLINVNKCVISTDTNTARLSWKSWLFA